MKKSIALLLTFTIIFTFAACANKGETVSGNETSDTVNTTKDIGKVDDATVSETLGVSKKEWNAAVEYQNFVNVTFSYKATFVSGYQDAGPHMGVLKITEDAVVMDGELITAEETVTAAKNMYIDTILAVINNFDNFEYDNAKKCYESKQNVTYITKILDYEATITAENVSVELDSENRIEKISCKMTQDFINGGPTTYVLDAEFTFTDYGTTTVE